MGRSEWDYRMGVVGGFLILLVSIIEDNQSSWDTGLGNG